MENYFKDNLRNTVEECEGFAESLQLLFLNDINNPNDKDDNSYDGITPVSPKVFFQNRIKKCNTTFEEYWRTKSEVLHDKLNRLLAILATSINPVFFDINNIEVTTFFINLSKLMSTLETRSTLFWSAVGLLEIATQISTTKNALVEKFRFMHILSKLLMSINNLDRIHNVLSLVENLSYGVCITWQEPFLVDFMKLLVNFMLVDNESIKTKSLSILVNLCYKNLPAIYTLLKSISVEKFLQDIQCYGIFAVKMTFILGDNLTGVKKQEIHSFIKFTFTEVSKSIIEINYSLLRHTIDFFLDIKSRKLLFEHFQDYPSYKSDIQSVLHSFEEGEIRNRDFSSFSEDAKCLSILLDLLKSLIEICFQAGQLHDLSSDILSYALNWITNIKVGSKSLDIISTILKIDDEIKHLSKVEYYEIIENVSHVVNSAKVIQMEPEQCTAIIRIILILIPHYEIPEYILQKFIFGKIFKKLLTRVGEKSTGTTIVHDNEVPMYMSGLFVMSKLAQKDADNVWNMKLKQLLHLPVIKLIVTKSILGGRSEICSYVFDLSKHNSFPCTDISMMLVREQLIIKATTIKANSIRQPKYFEKGCQDFNSFINYSLDKRLGELIEKISSVCDKGEFGNINMSDIMELFEFKMAIYENDEKNLLLKLDECNIQITNLSNQHALLSAEVSKYQSESFSYQMKIEKISKDNFFLEDEIKHMKELLKNTQIQIESDKEFKCTLLTELKSRDKEILELKDKLSEYHCISTERNNKIKSIENNIIIEQMKCEKLEEEATACENMKIKIESEICKKKDIITDHMSEIENLEKTQKFLDEKLGQESYKLKQKNDILKMYTRDIEKIEEMRQKVVKLVERK